MLQTQRKTDFIRPTYTNEELMTALTQINTFFILRIGTLNALASFMMHDTITALKKTPLWKHEAKKYATKAMETYDKWEKKIQAEYHKRNKYEVWLTITDNLQEATKQEVWMLMQTMWNAFTKRNVPYPKERAMVEATMALIDFSQNCFDALCKETFTHYGFRVNEEFVDFRINDVAYLWGNVSRKINDIPQTRGMSMDEEQDVQNAMKIFSKKALDKSVFVHSASDAMFDNDYLTDEEAEEVRQARAELEREEEEERRKARQANERYWKEKARKKPSDITNDDLEMLKEKFNGKGQQILRA